MEASSTTKSADPSRLEEAATVIQTHYRAHLLRRKALSSLATLRSNFSSLQSGFVFLSQPAFSDKSTESKPILLYNSINAPIHAYEDSLVKLLSKIDEVESGGDDAIRKARKELAKYIHVSWIMKAKQDLRLNPDVL